MGKMLTYEGSCSLAHSIEELDAELYPDENFASKICLLLLRSTFQFLMANNFCGQKLFVSLAFINCLRSSLFNN